MSVCKECGHEIEEVSARLVVESFSSGVCVGHMIIQYGSTKYETKGDPVTWSFSLGYHDRAIINLGHGEPEGVDLTGAMVTVEWSGKPCLTMRVYEVVRVSNGIGLVGLCETPPTLTSMEPAT